jgi:glycosyltransferase involved in cell wall biosynthesis/O-antigen/teichoic acid export membrane protein
MSSQAAVLRAGPGERFEPGRVPGDEDGRAATASGAPLLRRIAVNAFALAVGGLGAIFTVLIARLLGKAALGGFALAWATADLLSKVGTLGLDQGATALVARRRGEGDTAGARGVFRVALTTGLVLSALVAAAAWPALGWAAQLTGQSPELLGAQRVMLLALPAVALYRIANGSSRGLGIMQHDALSGGLVENLTKVSALVALVAIGLPLTFGASGTAVVAAVAGYAAGGSTAWLLARGALAGKGDAPSAKSARGLFPLSTAAAATGLANLAMMRLDVLVLGWFVSRAPGLDAASFGVYCAAAEIAGVTRKVRFAAEPPFLHAVATAQGRGRGEEERAVVDNMARWMLPVTFFMAAGLALGAPLWLGLFGPGFGQGALVLTLLVVAQSLGSYSGLVENLLLLRRPALNLVNLGAGIAAQLGLGFVLVPRMGAYGAALAAVAGYALLALLRFGELHAMGARWPWRRLQGATAAFFVALAPALLVLAVRPGQAGATAAVVCFIAVFASAVVRWALEDGDRAALWGIVPSFVRPRARAEAGRTGRAAPGPSLESGPTAHTAIIVVSSEADGGAARSAFLLARDLPHAGIRPFVALHREGPLSRRLAAHGIPFEVVEELPEDLMRRPGRPASVWAVPGNLRALARCVSRLRQLALREGAEILYGQGTWANIVSALAARGSNVGAVWHIRNDHRPLLKRLLMRGVARACAVRAIVAVSRSAAAPLEGLPMPLHVVENGADLSVSDPARTAPDDLRGRLGIPRDAVVAGYAGRLLPHKGIDVLMEAARLAMRRAPSLHLVILGGNPTHTGRDVRAELSERAASFGLADRIHLPGWVGDVERALAGLDVAVVPSTCRECCSRALIESLVLGIPVVATRIGGNPELLRDGEDGLLVPPGDPEGLADALVTLATDAARRGDMAARALEERRRFDSRAVARRAAAVLRTAAAGYVRLPDAWEPAEVRS